MSKLVFGGSTAGAVTIPPAIAVSVVPPTPRPRYKVGDILNDAPILSFSEFERIYFEMYNSTHESAGWGVGFINYIPYYGGYIDETKLGTAGHLHDISLNVDKWNPVNVYQPSVSGEMGGESSAYYYWQGHGSIEDVFRVFREKANDPKTIYNIVGTPAGDGRDRAQIWYIRRGDLMIPIHRQNTREKSSWVEFRDNILPFAGILIAFIPGVGQAVGSFIMGQTFAATYPVLTSAIGGVATKTAMNGGDVGAAVLSVLSGGAGNFVGGLIDLPVISDIAGAVTSAAINGGDLNQAAIAGLIGGGISQIDNGGGTMFDDYDSYDFGGDITAPGYDYDSYDFGGDFSAPSLDYDVYDFGGVAPDINYNNPFYSYEGDATSPDYDYDPYDFQGPAIPPAEYQNPFYSYEGDATAPTDSTNPFYAYEGDATAPTPAPPVLATQPPRQTTAPRPGAAQPPAGTNTISLQGVLNTLSPLVQLGLKVNAAVRGQNNTTLRPAQTQPGMMANTNGRLPNGQQIQPGVVYRTANGGAVVNNGDGTYTVARPDGKAVIQSYANNQVVGNLPTGVQPQGGMSNTLLFAGLGVGAALLLGS